MCFLLFLLSVNVLSTFGYKQRGGKRPSRYDSDEDDDDDSYDHDDHRHEEEEKGWDWGAAAGLGVLILVIAIICGLLSLLAWLSCHVYSKCKQVKVGDYKGSSRHTSSPPSWSSELIFQPELAIGFGLVSEGFTRVGPSQLIRTRQSSSLTDGASWAVPMTKGKHLFEITWPWVHRGSHAGVGVATTEAPIKCKQLQALVGSNCHSWGLDIVRRKALHNNKSILACPTDGSYVPDKFLMYVDVDEGKLGFGNDVTYWGDVITNLPKQGTKPLHVMIGATRWQAEVSVTYRGSAANAETNTGKMNPPHHLPPLFPNTPPMYTEIENMKNEALVGGQPAIHVMTIQPISPPPPYVQHPVGYDHDVKSSNV